MTYEEAILECNYAKDFTTAERKIAMDIAIDAIKKQIPKKPGYRNDGYADGDLVYDTWICPNCGSAYELDTDDYMFCPDCGQAIDWNGD